jgi:hypothetical protein
VEVYHRDVIDAVYHSENPVYGLHFLNKVKSMVLACGAGKQRILQVDSIVVKERMSASG